MGQGMIVSTPPHTSRTILKRMPLHAALLCGPPVACLRPILSRFPNTVNGYKKCLRAWKKSGERFVE
jgi:hypothetical protein